MDWDQISRNWDEMTRRIHPQSRQPSSVLSTKPSSGLFGGQAASSAINGDLAPVKQEVGRADISDDANAAKTLA